MKKIFLTLTIVLTGLTFFTSCDSTDTDNVSFVTNYPVFELIGEETVVVDAGGTFEDPGVIVTENGVEIPYTSSVKGLFQGGSSLDTNVSDIYTITYSATNQDGFSGTTTRTVIVSTNDDLSLGLAGLYTSTVTRNGVLTGQYTDMEYVLIWENPDGTYEISDGIGGYYDIGRGYGVGYAATGAVITVNDFATNNFSYSAFEVGGFGGACIMSALTPNAANSTISFSTEWDAGYIFDVVLTQVQL
ncbi:BT_2262 family domain-containing protein [Flavobacterium chuncheonense]|uniref:BT_2262 family domain-containing protein n=1 Tax=Flavobacterium chuncheonense TaxID=2026653 RepID=A0ABW5YJG7_9FLAO